MEHLIYFLKGIVIIVGLIGFAVLFNNIMKRIGGNKPDNIFAYLFLPYLAVIAIIAIIGSIIALGKELFG